MDANSPIATEVPERADVRRSGLSTGPLELDRKSVVGGFDFELTPSIGHVRTEMGEDETATIEVVAMFAQFLEAEMEIEAGLMKGALADEQVAAGNLIRKIREPSRVPRIRDLFLAEPNPVALGIGLGLMRGRESLNSGGTRRERFVRVDLAEMNRVWPVAIA